MIVIEPRPLPEESPPTQELTTCDLSALAPQDARHWVANAVVQCIAATDAGPRIDRHKLGDLVERHIDRLMTDNRFDCAPVLEALCRIKGVSETNLYIGVVNLQQRLASMNIEMVMPDMHLDQWMRSQLLREAHEATERARLEREQFRLRGAVQDLHRAKLGSLLVQERLIGEDELQQALELQEKTGGRLGSNLVHLGFIGEADLARFLGRQLGLPCVTEIRHIPPDARRAIPQEILIKRKLVPLSIDAREIQLAMIDPTDLAAIDEIGFVTDRRVRPVVAPELVVDFARARFFGIRQAPRLLATTQSEPSAGPPTWPRSVFERGPVVLPAPDDEPYDLTEFAHDLLSSEVEDDVYPPLWRMWGERFHLAAHFAVEQGMVRGVRITGRDDQTTFTKAQLPACSHLVLERVVQSAEPYAGPCGGEGQFQWLSQQLELSPTAFVWILPVHRPSEPVTALLVGHQPRDEPPESDWVEAVWTAAHTTMTMVHARRALRRIQAGGRPTVHRAQNVL